MAPQISAAKDATVERYSSGLGAMEVVSLPVVIAFCLFGPIADGDTPRPEFPN
jgi:hypothetical protein